VIAATLTAVEEELPPTVETEGGCSIRVFDLQYKDLIARSTGKGLTLGLGMRLDQLDPPLLLLEEVDRKGVLALLGLRSPLRRAESLLLRRIWTRSSTLTMQ